MTMRTVIRVMLAVLVLAGCSRKAPPPAASSVASPELITAFGPHQAADGLLNIVVSETDGKLEVQHRQHFDKLPVTHPIVGQIASWRNASIMTTVSKPSWKAHTGWFVFVENQSRVWAYDGVGDLWLLVTDAQGNSAGYGPGSLPNPVPDPVWSRLSAAVKNQIERHED